MRHLLPCQAEVAIFATMAILCAAIADVGQAPDLGLSLLSIPIFISAAVMGLCRHWQLTDICEKARQESSTTTEESI